MSEAFFREQKGQKSDDEKDFFWKIVEHTPNEDIVIHHGEGSEYDTKTLRADIPDLEARIKTLEAHGWKIVNKGDFVVLEREHEDDETQ